MSVGHGSDPPPTMAPCDGYQASSLVNIIIDSICFIFIVVGCATDMWALPVRKGQQNKLVTYNEGLWKKCHTSDGRGFECENLIEPGREVQTYIHIARAFTISSILITIILLLLHVRTFYGRRVGRDKLVTPKYCIPIAILLALLNIASFASYSVGISMLMHFYDYGSSVSIGYSSVLILVAGLLFIVVTIIDTIVTVFPQPTGQEETNKKRLNPLTLKIEERV
eukprot:GHVR01027334.1.p1 GENE.GHVR01027334.1~~GHVR01027334.1.p1  ORF type:complete len:224 (-),score=8.53 GHVR01027334.1:496-1167(-)